MLSLEKKLLFIHVPKTGGNSVQNILSDYSEDKIVSENELQDGVERFEVKSKYPGLTKHSTLWEYKAAIEPDVYKSLYIFSTIRNPWDMMISYYFSPNMGVTEWDRNDFIKLLKKTPTLDYYIQEFSLLRRFMYKLGLDIDKSGKLDKDIDFLMRVENLNEDFKHVCNEIGVTYKELPVRNKSSRKHYSTYYDEELVEKVAKKFHKEITFGRYVYEKKA